VLVDTQVVKPHLKVLATSGASLYVIGNGMLIAQTPTFTVRVTDARLTNPKCVLSAVKFNSFVTKAKGSFSVQPLEGGVRLVSGSLSVDFPALDVKLQDVRPDYQATIPTPTLKELLVYASAVTDVNAVQTYAGIVHLLAEEDLFEDEASSIRVAATDGYRALKMTLSCSMAPLNLFVPATLAAAAVHFPDETTQIADEPNYIAFRSGVVEAIATKFAVKLPDIGSAFPGRQKHKMSVIAEDMQNTLANLNPFLDSKAPDVLCSFQQNLTVSTGTARDELKYTSATVPDRHFKAQAKYLTDFMSRATGTVYVETDNFDRILLTNGNKKYLLAAKV
jgi:hypothetical protein